MIFGVLFLTVIHVATTIAAPSVHTKYADLHTSFSALLDKSKESTWKLLNENNIEPGSAFERLCGDNEKLHRLHLDNIFGVKAADNAVAVLLEETADNAAVLLEKTTRIQSQVFDLHDAVLDSREHYANHAKSLADHIGKFALKRQESLVTSLVDLGESVSSDPSSTIKSSGFISFVKFVKRLAQGFLAILTAIASLIRRVLDSSYLGGGASISTLTGPAPTINIEFSAGDLFVNSATVNEADPMKDETSGSDKTKPKIDPKINPEAKYEWSVGEYGPPCPLDPCSVSRPVIQMRFVRCIKKIEGQDSIEADDSNCKSKSPDSIKLCPKCIAANEKKKGGWRFIWSECSVNCGLGKFISCYFFVHYLLSPIHTD